MKFKKILKKITDFFCDYWQFFLVFFYSWCVLYHALNIFMVFPVPDFSSDPFYFGAACCGMFAVLLPLCVYFFVKSFLLRLKKKRQQDPDHAA